MTDREVSWYRKIPRCGTGLRDDATRRYRNRLRLPSFRVPPSVLAVAPAPDHSGGCCDFNEPGLSVALDGRSQVYEVKPGCCQPVGRNCCSSHIFEHPKLFLERVDAHLFGRE